MEDTEKIKGIIKSIFDAFKDGDTHEIESHLHEEASVWDVFTPDIIAVSYTHLTLPTKA